MEHVVYHSPCIGVIRSNGDSGLEGPDELSSPSLVTVVSISMKLSGCVEGCARWEVLIDSTEGLPRTCVLLLPPLHEAHDSTCLGSLPQVSQSFVTLLGFVILSWFRITCRSHCSMESIW
jgi:hypothetical protein